MKLSQQIYPQSISQQKNPLAKYLLCPWAGQTPPRSRTLPAIGIHQRADLNDVYSLTDRLYETRPSASTLTMHLRLSVSAVQIKSMASKERTVISVKLYNDNWRRRFWSEGFKVWKTFSFWRRCRRAILPVRFLF